MSEWLDVIFRKSNIEFQVELDGTEACKLMEKFCGRICSTTRRDPSNKLITTEKLAFQGQ